MHYDALNEIGEKKVDHDEDVILKIDHVNLGSSVTVPIEIPAFEEYFNGENEPGEQRSKPYVFVDKERTLDEDFEGKCFAQMDADVAKKGRIRLNNLVKKS